MEMRSDVIRATIWAHGDGSWGVQIGHTKELGVGVESLMPVMHDYYDFRGQGAVTEVVLSEIAVLVTELLGYSAERLCGLQPALF